MKKEELQKDIEKMFKEYRETLRSNYSDKNRFFRDYCEAIITQQKQELLAEVKKILEYDEVTIYDLGLGVDYKTEPEIRNQFRSELRTKLDELEKKI